jgi:hypothetical protein
MEKKMVKMKEKTLTLLTIIFIAMSITGFTYAQWNDVIVVSNRMRFGDLTLRFVHPLDSWDNDDATKDVGKLNCYYTNPDPVEGYETLAVAITNAYPDYEAYCNFTLKNIGTLPDHIDKVLITPAIGLEVSENYTDVNNNPIGWSLDDAATHKPVLYVYVYDSTDSSLVCNTLDGGDELQGKATVQVTDNAKECHTYGFEVEIIYGQVP